MSGPLGTNNANGVKVAFLGPLGSYSHQAALNEFPAEKAFASEPRTTIKDVFEAVQAGETVFGVVPFENSSHGSVVQTLDLFSDRAQALRDIHVCGEIFVDIEHCLLGFENRSRIAKAPTPGYATPTIETPNPVHPRSHPLTDVSHIKHIYSHPQAFGQSFNFINTYLHQAELHEVSSTSKGAEIVSQSGDPSMAAIASESAAGILSLKVLARGIQDLDNNTTRFFVIRKSNEQNELSANEVSNEYATWKSLVGFTIDHTKAGALADALNVFKLHNLNLTSINSRPSHRRQWHYVFLVEFESEDQDGEDHKALDDLKQFTEELRWFGQFRSKPGGHK